MKKLYEERAHIWHEMRAILDAAEKEGRELTAEEAETYDRLEKELERLTERIEREERLRAIEARIRRAKDVDTGPVSHEADLYTEAWRAYARWGLSRLTAEQRDALLRQAIEDRAMQTVPGAAGGFLVPEGFARRIIEVAQAFGGVRRAASVITTANGAPLPVPRADDTGNEGELLAEGGVVAAQDVPVDQVVLGAYTYTSKLVRVSLQLLQDSAFDLEAFLQRRFGERIGRITERHYTLGTDAGQPQGIVTGATNEKTGGAISYDALVDLLHAVDPAYRTDGAVWMLADATLSDVRKLKDAQNRPLWQLSVAQGQPDTLLGFPYIVNNYVPAHAVGNRCLLFGNIREAYLIRDVVGIGFLRLEERYADQLQVGFLAWLRTDGAIVNQKALAVYKRTA